MSKYNNNVEDCFVVTQLYKMNGQIYYKLKDYDKAITDLDIAIKINKNSEALYYLRGLAYEKLEQYDKAKENYEKAIEIKPEYQHHIDGLARVKKIIGK